MAAELRAVRLSTGRFGAGVDGQLVWTTGALTGCTCSGAISAQCAKEAAGFRFSDGIQLVQEADVSGGNRRCQLRESSTPSNTKSGKNHRRVGWVASTPGDGWQGGRACFQRSPIRTTASLGYSCTVELKQGGRNRCRNETRERTNETRERTCEALSFFCPAYYILRARGSLSRPSRERARPSIQLYIIPPSICHAHGKRGRDRTATD